MLRLCTLRATARPDGALEADIVRHPMQYRTREAALADAGLLMREGDSAAASFVLLVSGEQVEFLGEPAERPTVPAFLQVAT